MALVSECKEIKKWRGTMKDARVCEWKRAKYVRGKERCDVSVIECGESCDEGEEK